VICQAPSNADLQQLTKAIYGISNRARVVVPFTFYVNGASGNNANDGLTALTPFQTIQKAVDVASLYAPGPNGITIQCADYPSYTGFVVPSYSIPVLYLQGNASNPNNVVINGGVTPAIYCGAYNTIHASNVKLQATGGQHIGPGSCGVVSQQYGTIVLHAGVIFGRCDLACISSSGMVAVGNPITISGPSCDHVLYAASGSIICGSYGSPLTVTISGPIAVAGAFATSFTSGSISSTGVTWSGAANITGQRYVSNYNGGISTLGAGPNYFPGTVAGVAINGGYYQ
jgi:hypothetical protein